MINRYTKVLAASPFLRAPPKSRSPQAVPGGTPRPRVSRCTRCRRRRTQWRGGRYRRLKNQSADYLALKNSSTRATDPNRMTFNLFPLSVRRKFCQYIEHSFWVCTSGHKIGIDLSETHDSLRVDDEGSRDRQLPFVAAIALRNIIAEIKGNSLNFRTQLVNQPILPTDQIFVVRENGESELLFICQELGKFGFFGRHGDECRAQRFHLRQSLLIGSQFEIAERTPLAPIEA